MKKEYRNRFLDDKKYPTCMAPWHALTIKWGGTVVPDIIYKDRLGNINDQTLAEIWHGDAFKKLREDHRNRIIPPACMNCAKKEKSGRSRRMFFWDKMDYELRVESEWHSADMEPDIRYLDFTLSNKCNLACIHCNPFVSTSWKKDGKALNKENPEYWTETQTGYNGVDDLTFMDNLFANPEYFRNLEVVALRGGEPLYDEHCYSVLKWFVDAGLAANVSLDISTNATVVEQKFKDIFAEFKHVELLISIEAVDELYSIIRGGKYTWEDLNKNIDQFYEMDNVEVVFAVTVMSTNVFELDKIWDWFAKHHRKRASIAMTNVVVSPAYLNIANLPLELKQQALKKMENIPTSTIWPLDSHHVDMFEYQTGVADIRNGLKREVDPVEQKKRWKHFLQYTRDLDRLRKTDTFAAVPELAPYKEDK